MKVLTETNTYDPTVTVPEGVDSRNTAAEDVEAIAQVLADRTKYLKDQVDTKVARLASANTFSAGPQHFTTLDSSGNADIGGTLQASHITSTHEVHANNDVTAGSDVLALTGAVHGNTLEATTTLTVGTTAHVVGVATVDSDVHIPANKRYLYVGGPALSNVRQKVINIQDAIAFDVSTLDYTGVNLDQDQWNNVDPGDDVFVVLPVRLPSGAQILSFDIVGKAPVNPSDFVGFFRAITWTGTPTITLNAGIGMNSSTDPTNLVVDNYVGSPTTVIDNATQEWFLRVRLRPNNELHAVRVTFTDPGPRNE